MHILFYEQAVYEGVQNRKKRVMTMVALLYDDRTSNSITTIQRTKVKKDSESFSEIVICDSP